MRSAAQLNIKTTHNVHPQIVVIKWGHTNKTKGWARSGKSGTMESDQWKCAEWIWSCVEGFPFGNLVLTLQKLNEFITDERCVL